MNTVKIRLEKADSQRPLTLPPTEFTVEDSISKELLRLSIEDRSAIYEEIHGVKCLATNETPELTERSLKEFDRALIELVQDRKRKRESIFRSNSNNDGNTPTAEEWKSADRDILRNVKSLYAEKKFDNNNSNDHCYLNESKIRLCFLRTEFFDVKRAVRRFVGFLEYTSELFGDFVAERPIRISDFDDDEKVALKNSRQQLLPFRDRSGRQVYVSVGDCGFELDAVMRNKIRMFLLCTAMQDNETQCKGVVVISWPSGDTWPKILSKISQRDQEERKRFVECNPLRFASFHLCFQDTPFFRSLATLCVFSLDSQTRVVTKIHFGESIEIQYKLMGYGIPVDLLPLSHTGNVKTTNHLLWMNALKWQLQEEDTTTTNAMKPQSAILKSQVVVCPYFYDVLSRKGQRYTNNPGNMFFRGLIESTSVRHEASSRIEKFHITQGILQEIERRGGRFLEWSSAKNAWFVAEDRKSVHSKIACTFRELKRGKRSASKPDGNPNNNKNGKGNALSGEAAAAIYVPTAGVFAQNLCDTVFLSSKRQKLGFCMDGGGAGEDNPKTYYYSNNQHGYC